MMAAHGASKVPLATPGAPNATSSAAPSLLPSLKPLK